MQNMHVQRLKGGNPTTGLTSGRLVTYPKELNITFKLQCRANRTAMKLIGRITDKGLFHTISYFSMC